MKENVDYNITLDEIGKRTDGVEITLKKQVANEIAKIQKEQAKEEMEEK